MIKGNFIKNLQKSREDNFDKFRMRWFTINTFVASLPALSFLSLIGYALFPLHHVLILTAISGFFLILSVLPYKSQSYRLPVTLHVIGVVFAIGYAGIFLPGMQNEYLLFIPLCLTVFGSFPYSNQRVNNAMFVGFLAMGGLLFAKEIFGAYDTLEIAFYQNFNQYFLGTIFYISVVEVSVAVYIQQKALEINKKNTDRYLNLFNNSLEGILLYDLKLGKYLNCNLEICHMLGTSREQILSNFTRFDIAPPFQADGRPTADHMKKHIEKLKAGIEPLRFEFLHKRWNGEIFESETTLIPRADNPDEILVVIKDISESRKIERAYKESEKNYRDIFYHSHQGILVYSIDEHAFLDCNVEAEKIFGCDKEKKLTSISIPDLMAPIQLDGRSAEEFIQEIWDEIRNKEKIEYLFIGKKSSGQTFIGEKTVVKDESRNRLLFFISDVTEKHQALNGIRERTAIYESLIEQSFDGIDIIELIYNGENNALLTGKILVRNDIMRDMMNGSDDPLIHIDTILPLSPSIQPNGISTKQLYNDINLQLVNERRVRHEWQIMQPDGRKIDIEAAAQLVNVGDKTILVRVYKNVTERKLQEALIRQQLKDLNEKNESLRKYIASNMQLENFAFVASHDMREPLITIMSYSQLLEKRLSPTLGDLELKYFNYIVSATKNLQSLIESLLFYARVSTSGLKVENVSVQDLIQEIQVELHAVIQVKKATIQKLQFPQGIRADKVKLKQVFQNLISNALKFSRNEEEPLIVISCESQQDCWLFSVKDNGLGIPAKYMETIFLLFKRLQSRSQYEGAGIGLALCKSVVEQHKGSIWVESAPEVGSTFHFTINKDL